MRKILILLFMFSCLLHGEKLFDKYVFTVVGGTYSEMKGKRVIMYDVLNYFEGGDINETTLIMENIVDDIVTLELSPGIEPRAMKSLASKDFLFFVLNDMYYRDSSEIDNYPSSVMMFKCNERYYSIILSFENVTFLVLNLELVETIEFKE